MNKRLKFLPLILSMIFCLSFMVSGQETTGSIEVIVKDPQGAVVPNVTITVATADATQTSSAGRTGSTTGFRRSATSDQNGFQRFLQVPPGLYTVLVDAVSGFGAKTVNNVQVVLGKITPINIDLMVGGAQVTVDVTGSEVAAIDPTDTKIQTNINAQTAELLPKGTNFSSVLKVSPATRPEQGGFQIDGASISENSFIIDGHEVTNPVDGRLNGNNNLPFQLVQEVQIKSSGFEAEYGGATGGVINVVTKGGSNQLRGELGVSFLPYRWQGSPNDVQYLSGNTLQYLSRPRDAGIGFYPSATLGGSILKDRMWFIGSYSPQTETAQRTINYRTFTNQPVVTNTQTYRFKQVNQYAFGRLDAQPIESLRLTASYTWNPIAQTGQLPGIDSQFNAVPTGNGLIGPAYQDQLGGRQNSNITNTQAVWTPTNNLILNFRFGYNFLNEKLGNYGRPDVLNTFRILCSGSSPANPPANAGCIRGQSNGIDAFINTVRDVTERKNYDADITYLFNGFGRHELKGGYQRTELGNDLLAPATDQIVLRFGQTISQYSGRPVTSTNGAIGAGSVIRQSSQGAVSSRNEAFFVQDKWQPTSRLTFNLGLRTERENVPSFVDGGEDIKFGFGQKLAPRIGVAYDLTGDGKTKLSAFYGQFFDRFKYELPRGLFGGEVQRQAFFEIFPGDFTNGNVFSGAYTPAGLLGGLGFQIGGGCPQTGFLAGRIRCELDFRIPSNTDLGPEFGFIDPDIDPYRQSEFTITFERQLAKNFVFLSRYTRKQLDRAIEDVGFINSQGGESYIITNPGYNAAADFYEDAGFTPVKAIRKYDALELRVERRFADNYYFNANYTWSRLIGNYSGLASSDEYGRQSPNANRFFDGPLFGYTLAGGPDEGGRLATDRPHAFKLSGAYNFDWNQRFGVNGSNNTEFQVFQVVQSGTPNTSFADISSFDTLVISERGNLGRLGTFSQTDFAVRHRYRFGRDNRFTMVAEVDFLNLFDQRNELDRFTLINATNYDPTDPAFGLVTRAEFAQFEAGAITFAELSIIAQRRYQQGGAPSILADINANAKDPRFNRPSVFQAPREVRFGFRFIF